MLPSVNLKDNVKVCKGFTWEEGNVLREGEDITLGRGWGEPGMGWYRDRAILRSAREHISHVYEHMHIPYMCMYM